MYAHLSVVHKIYMLLPIKLSAIILIPTYKFMDSLFY